MLGIALGAFTQGFTQGVDLRARIDDARDRKELRSGLKAANTEGTAAYDAQVAAGNEQANDPNAALSYIVPKVAHAYLTAGQPEVAAKWADWMDSANAKRGTKLFMRGLSQLQSGDVAGGIDAMTEAANLQGYGPDGKMTASEYYDEGQGRVTGYKFSFQQPDGKSYTKSVAVEDVAQFMAGIANPQAAFEMDQATKAAQSKADTEVETHGRKKLIEKQLGVGTGQMTQSQYQTAVQNERKRIEEAALVDDAIGEMSAEEREALAKQTVDQRLGLSGGEDAGPTIAVDPETGEQVETPDTATTPPAAPTDEELGVDPETTGSVTPAAPAAPSAPAPGVNQPQASPAADTTAPTDQKQQYMAQAEQALRQGGDPKRIGGALMAAGIPLDQWPRELQMAAQNAQLGIAGP